MACCLPWLLGLLGAVTFDPCIVCLAHFRCDFLPVELIVNAEIRENPAEEGCACVHVFFVTQEIKATNEKVQKKYGFCIIDGHKQKIGNFKIEPPGLFRGRGDHPKQGMLKRRVMPEDVIINCSKYVLSVFSVLLSAL